MSVPVGAINCCKNCTGEFLFDGSPAPFPFSMHRQAWCLTDLSSLWEIPNQRGANVIIPGTPGRFPTPRRDDETDYALPFIISGVVDKDNALTSVGENEQLRRNIAYLRAQVLSPPAPPLTTRAALLVSPDALTTLRADIQVVSMVPTRKDSGYWAGVLHITIPAGAFA